MNSTSRAVAMLTASVLAAIGVGVGIVAPSSSGKLVESIPADAQSALMTLNLRYSSPNGTNPDSTNREAITLRGPFSDQILSSTGSFGCGQTALPCLFVIDGVEYRRVGYGRWSALRIPSGSPSFTRWTTNAGDTLRGFEKDTIGGVHKVGYGLVGGVLTTEYRGDLSLPELYVHDQQASAVDLVYELAHLYPMRSPTLSAPMSVWVDRDGEILEVSGSAPYQSLTARGVSAVPTLVPTSRSSATTSSSQPAETRTADSVTVTASVSDFGIPVRVAAPPRSETTLAKNRITSVTGRVSISGSTSSGLLVLGLALAPASRRFSDEAVAPDNFYVVASVAADGPYSASVFGTGHGQYLRIAPYFYPGTTRHNCKMLEITSPLDKTTVGVNLTC